MTVHRINSQLADIDRRVDEIKRIKTHFEEELREDHPEKVSMENANGKSMKGKVKDSALLRNSGKKHNKMQVEAVKVVLQRDVPERKDAKKKPGHSRENGEVEDVDVKSQTQSNEIDDLDE